MFCFRRNWNFSWNELVYLGKEKDGSNGYGQRGGTVAGLPGGQTGSSRSAIGRTSSRGGGIGIHLIAFAKIPFYGEPIQKEVHDVDLVQGL